jgi:pimeloyl-ACP methyl ester carboxylesterase
MSRRSIVLVHGLFVTRRCWDRWSDRYGKAGERVVVPAYPGREEAPEVLRGRHPDAAAGRLGLADVLAHFETVVRSLEDPPILIGHSFGGLVVQLLLQRGLGAAGVAVNSVPPQGVLATRWSFYRSVWPAVNPLVPASRPYLMPLDHFRYAFANALPPEEQRRAWEREVAPESRRLARAGLSAAARVDFRKSRPPLLLVAGEKDHIMPASLNRANAARYAASPSVTAFREYPGRDHLIISEPGWEEVADDALAWAARAVDDAACGVPEAAASSAGARMA